MEPFIITKSVFNIVERGLFSACFRERRMFHGSFLIGVDWQWDIYSNLCKSCCSQHFGFHKGEKKE